VDADASSSAAAEPLTTAHLINTLQGNSECKTHFDDILRLAFLDPQSPLRQLTQSRLDSHRQVIVIVMAGAAGVWGMHVAYVLQVKRWTFIVRAVCRWRN
jgi:hypothetical protein